MILFWRLLAASRLSGLMFSRPTKARHHPGALRLVDEVGDAVAERIDLDGEIGLEPFLLVELYEAVEEALPVPVAGEIVVSDEEGLDPLRQVLADDPFEVVGGAEAALAALDVDDRAEAALEGTAAPQIEARPLAAVPLQRLLRHPGNGDVGDVRQVFQIIVDRLQLAVPRIPEHLIEPPFLGLAGEERAADIQRLLQLRRELLQHRQATGDVEPADHHRQTGGAEFAGEIERVVELVGLDADQPDQRFRPALADLPDDLRGYDMLVAFVDRHEVEGDIGAEHLPLCRIPGEAVQRGERIGREDGAPPDDRIAVIVIMRRLDHVEVERLPLRHAGVITRFRTLA